MLQETIDRIEKVVQKDYLFAQDNKEDTPPRLNFAIHYAFTLGLERLSGNLLPHQYEMLLGLEDKVYAALEANQTRS